MSGFRLMLIRATAVLLSTTAMSVAAGLILPANAWRASAWLLPALAVSRA